VLCSNSNAQLPRHTDGRGARTKARERKMEPGTKKVCHFLVMNSPIYALVPENPLEVSL
jgi:hypothetical protein